MKWKTAEKRYVAFKFALTTPYCLVNKFEDKSKWLLQCTKTLKINDCSYKLHTQIIKHIPVTKSSM